MTTFRITGDGPMSRIEIGGVDVSKYATQFALSHSAGRLPSLDIEFLAVDRLVELDGKVSYVASAWGYHAVSHVSPLDCLQKLVASMEAAEAANAK